MSLRARVEGCPLSKDEPGLVSPGVVGDILSVLPSLPRDDLIEATDLLVQGQDLPENAARVLEGVFVNESVTQPYR